MFKRQCNVYHDTDNLLVHSCGQISNTGKSLDDIIVTGPAIGKLSSFFHVVTAVPFALDKTDSVGWCARGFSFILNCFLHMTGEHLLGHQYRSSCTQCFSVHYKKYMSVPLGQRPVCFHWNHLMIPPLHLAMPQDYMYMYHISVEEFVKFFWKRSRNFQFDTS